MLTRSHWLASGCGARVLVLTLLAGTLAGCVTEGKPKGPGLTRKDYEDALRASTPGAASSRASSSSSGGAGRSAETNSAASTALPSGPVARAAIAARSTDARVVMAVRPVGQVPFDGITLPLVSTDGRFIAVQAGPAPSWAALCNDPSLAEPGARGPLVSPLLRIAAVAVPGDEQLAKALGKSDAPGDPRQATLSPIDWPAPLPEGLLLGRSADARGFLVEMPRPGGSRWIGRVEWVTGALTWLVQGDAAAAFATFGVDGEIIYSRRERPTDDYTLVLDRGARGRFTAAMPGRSLVFPLVSADRAYIYALVVGGRRMSVAAFKRPSDEARGGALSVASSADLGVEGTLPSAFQTASPAQTPWPAQSEAFASVEVVGCPVIAMGPSGGPRVEWFDPRGNLGTGALIPLADGSACAVPLSLDAGRAGVLLGTGRELVYQSVVRSGAAQVSGAQTGSGGELRFGEEVSVLAGGAVPRAIAGNPRRFVVLVPPGRGDSQAVRVLMIEATESR